MKKEKAVISVILVTYNRVEFLEKAIDSILSQTFKSFELILVNNGSTDNTYEVCKKYKDQDSRVVLVSLDENKGASKGRNLGIQSANAKYITIVDDDDYCDKEMLENLFCLATEYNADISICGSYNDFGDRIEPYFIFNELFILNKIQALDELLKREIYNVAPPSKLFKKKLFNRIRFPENVLVDDIHVIYKVFSNANLVVAEGKPLYYFKKHHGNMTNFIQSSKLTPELLEEYLSMYKKRIQYLSRKVPEIKNRAEYSRWSYMISMCSKIIQYNLKDCETQYKYMKKKLIYDYKKIIKCDFITQNEMVKLKNIIEEKVLL